MPLLARVVPDVATDEEALLGAGWRVEAERGDAGATVTLTRSLVFTGATEAAALAAAREHVDAGGGA